MGRLKAVLAAAAAAAALGITAGPASASQVAVHGGVLRLTASPGELNDALVAANDDGGLLVADSGNSPAEPGAGCEPLDGFAACADAGSIALVLGDEDDVASIDAFVYLPATIDGGDGGDSLSAGGGPTLVRGGAGDDFISGGEDDDSVDAGSGADYVNTAGGDDRIAARDGSEDSVACGDGEDVVSADSGDVVDSDCETVSHSAAPAQPQDGGRPDPGADPPGASPTREERAMCIPKRRWVACVVRLRDSRLEGTFDVTLGRGSAQYARGRGKVVAGMFRVRLRTRQPLVNGTYRLRAVVQPQGGTPFKRAWRVGVLAFGR